MSDDDKKLEMASAIVAEAKRFGRTMSRQRALEIATEVQRYEDAIRQIASLEAMDHEPSEFLHALIRLSRG